MATVNQVQSLYIAYFGRPADSQGLTYWTEGVGADTALEVIADGFASTVEYQTTQEGETLNQIVNSFYVNLFGRDADVAGLTYWVDEILSGAITSQQVGLRIGQAALTEEASGNSDNVALNSKFTAATQWTTQSGTDTASILAYAGVDGVSAGINFLTPVLTEDTIPSEAATETAFNTLVTSSGTAGSYDLTVFTDIATDAGTTRLSGQTIISESTFKLDSGDQTINGNASTFQAADNLVDSSTSDNDVLNIAAANAVASANAVVSNIETINTAVTNFNAAITTTQFTGVESFVATGDIANGGIYTLTAANTGATSIDVSGLTAGNAASSTAITMDTTGTTVTGGDVSDALNGGGGATDTVNLGGGTNTFTTAGAGGSADTVIHDTAGASVVVTSSGTGAVTLTASVAGATANGGVGVNSTVDASSSSVGVALLGNTGNDTFTGTALSDTITTGAGTDSVTGGAGADNMTGAAGTDTFVQGLGDSVASTQQNIAAGVGGAFAAGDTITFGNGVDVINGFTAGAGNDVLDIAAGATAVPTAGIGVASNTLVAGTNYVLSGAFAGGVFTIAAAGAGADTLFIQGGAGTDANIITNDTMVVLVGVVDTAIVAANLS